MPTISGSTDPIDFQELQEKLITIACFRHGLSQADALSAYRATVAAWNEAAGRHHGELPQLQAFLRSFHERCAKLLPETPSERSTNRLSDLVRREDGRRVIASLAGITPESRRAFRALLGKRYEAER